jgi:hypothetical protein
MSLELSINQSAKWLNGCNSLINEQSFAANTRSRVAVALLHLSIEHHGSMHQLVNYKRYGSAFTLLRPQFEAYVRGVWFQRCATEQQLNKFIKKDKLPEIKVLLKNIEKVPGYEEGMLSTVKNHVWNKGCGYTHGGYVQVAYRDTANEITNDYEEEHIIGLISTACTITFLSSVAFSILVNSEEMANKLIEIHNSIFSKEA